MPFIRRNPTFREMVDGSPVTFSEKVDQLGAGSIGPNDRLHDPFVDFQGMNGHSSRRPGDRARDDARESMKEEHVL